MSVVDWQDVECGGYEADLELWRELARAQPDPILDVGAGTGRVALHLARHGHDVTALDLEPELLAALRERALREGLSIPTVVADAAALPHSERRFGLILMPMQTIQLLPGSAGRVSFLARAKSWLAPGGLVALALAEDLESFEEEPAMLPSPDIVERDGWRFISHPIAVRERGSSVQLERIRQAIAPDGSLSTEGDVIELARLSAGELEGEGAAAGLRPEPRREIPATLVHVGSTVVVLRG
jgi:SAM-dependent methyltransferase